MWGLEGQKPLLLNIMWRFIGERFYTIHTYHVGIGTGERFTHTHKGLVGVKGLHIVISH